MAGKVKVNVAGVKAMIDIILMSFVIHNLLSRKCKANDIIALIDFQIGIYSAARIFILFVDTCMYIWFDPSNYLHLCLCI